MIKKTITVAAMLVLSIALIWAEWEGNAIAGSRDEFPTGLFASSDLFPKYTLIEVINLEQNTTSRAVIINTTGAEGMLVKVSPELAAVLAIQTGNTVRVRVSVPPLVAEEGADPMLLGKNENTPSAPTAAPAAKPAVENTQPTLVQPVQPEKPPREVPVPVPPSDQDAMRASEEKNRYPAAEVTEPVKPKEKPMTYVVPPDEISEPALTEPESVPAPAAVSDVGEPVEPLSQSENLEEIEKPVLVAALIQEPPVQEDTESSDAYPVPDAAEIAAPEETVPVAEVAPVTEAAPIEEVAPVAEVTPIAEPEPTPAEDKTVESIEEPEAPSEPAIAEIEPEKDTEEPVDEPELFAVQPEEVQPEQTDEPQNEPEVVITEEVPTEDNNTADKVMETYAMLVPTGPREPVGQDVPQAKKPAKPAPAVVPPVTQPAEESYTTDSLKKGLFYVQIGRFKDMLNVESFVQLYGKQYPVTVEKSPATKGTEVFYKVYIGPLQKDERGAALETFQKLGYKDAFLKKAP